MAPRKSTTPKPHGPPRTPPELRAIKVGVSFRADQRAALTRLQSDRRLSLLCQRRWTWMPSWKPCPTVSAMMPWKRQQPRFSINVAWRAPMRSARTSWSGTKRQQTRYAWTRMLLAFWLVISCWLCRICGIWRRSTRCERQRCSENTDAPRSIVPGLGRPVPWDDAHW